MKRVVATLLACAGVLPACGASDSNKSPRPPAASATETVGGVASTPRRGPLVKLGKSQFGPVLFDGHNRALYVFTREAKRKPRCYGACAQAWPPFYARARPRAGRGVQGSLLGTIGRRDGRLQVTYRGQPLYFYVRDPKGQVLCNDVVEFGGTWFALNAAGKPPA